MPTFRFNQPRQARSTAFRSRRGGGLKIRLLMALAVAGFAFLSYCSSSEYNEITGTEQRVAMTQHQEIALGLQAAPKMVARHGGLLPDQAAQNLVDQVGARILARSDASKSSYQFEFHLLNDHQTINAFALPGGQVFITQALFAKFTREDQLAGVLAHEIGHVVARHSAQQMAKQSLTQGLTSAVVLGTGEYSAGQMAGMVGKAINMKYGRGDEIESDLLGVRFLHQAGYDPAAMIEVMEILASVGGGTRQPEFFASHPNPENRIQRIREAIAAIR